MKEKQLLEMQFLGMYTSVYFAILSILTEEVDPENFKSTLITKNIRLFNFGH